VRFVTRVSLYFWNLRKILRLLIPILSRLFWKIIPPLYSVLYRRTQTNDEAVTLSNKFLCHFPYFFKVYNKIKRYFCYSSNINPPYCACWLGELLMLLWHCLLKLQSRVEVLSTLARKFIDVINCSFKHQSRGEVLSTLAGRFIHSLDGLNCSCDIVLLAFNHEVRCCARWLGDLFPRTLFLFTTFLTHKNSEGLSGLLLLK
jgi:hypothetical protein